ncbi:MAG TPA: tryptophan synthase subunit alpha [Acidimicrobiales bacterium]|nr:tryptophan synthase subunit alpha [Acidimicrobiales bacterium]
MSPRAGRPAPGSGPRPGPLETSLRSRRDAGHKLLVPYVTGGLGPRWVEVLEAMAAAGADAVEVGIPFSDPAMDGATIQAASQRALDLGATPTAILTALRDADVDVPLVAMTYYNVVFRTGHRRFAAALDNSGVAGAIVPDLPLEELEPWSKAALSEGVETVLLAAPVTPDDRLAIICERSRGFVYGVSVMGITGERSALSSSAALMGKRLKALTDKPVLIGFGVSTPAQAVEACAEADGVIVASALMRRMLDGAEPDEIGAAVDEIRAALDAG